MFAGTMSKLLIGSLLVTVGGSAWSPAPRPGVVTVVATEYRFEMPDTLTAGPVTFRVDNHGREAHHLTLVRLGEGRTAADLVQAMRAGGPPPAWATFVGGPNAVDPGGTSLATTVPLEAGRYAALCMIPGPDGVPHVMKGMVRDLTVRPGPVSTALQAASGPTITLVDYGFKTSRPLTAGTHRVLVRNDGAQPHELVVARLAPGKSAADLAAWAEKMAGPPPGHFLGGVSPLSPHRDNELDLTLEPGHYALLCFLPDAHDGKPHVAHGMLHDLVVER